MDCKKVEDLLSSYLENDLPEAQRREVSLHLKQCPGCARLVEGVENLVYLSPELEEEVPFFLKNRLCNICESREEKTSRMVFLKWAAAVVGTFVLFLNLFYFTNIYPAANRTLHKMVSNIEKFAVETGAFIEKMGESKDNPIFSLFGGESEAGQTEVNGNVNVNHEGGSNG